MESKSILPRVGEMEKAGSDVAKGGSAELPAGTEAVVLIHGLWMRGEVLLMHRLRLRQRGFEAACFSYPSWSASLADNVERLADYVAALAAARIHLVGHSLGGLLALAFLSRHPDARIGRVVLLGSPYAACRCGSFLAARRPLSPVLGRCLGDWLSQPLPAPPPGVEIGVIAGTRRLGMGCLIPGLPRPNDGVVAVSETRVPGAKDNIALVVSHSGMLLSTACSEQIANFLRRGSFIHA